MTREEIENIQHQIEEMLAEHLDHRNHTDVMERLTNISTMLATGAKCIAESKRIELTTRGAWLRQHEDKVNKMKPSVAKEFVNTSCVDTQILSLRCDRNYSALTHAGENLRSVLSTVKTEMLLIKNS